ncbi:MAG: OB-fold domain-containing protein [archaeon]
MVQGSLPLHWRKYPERYRLEGNKNTETGEEFFPARVVDPKGGRKAKLIPKEMPREGKILSWTEVFVGPLGFEYETPYFLAIIELTNKVKLLTQIVDSEKDKMKFGAKVKKVFRKIADEHHEAAIAYGYKFKVI